MKDGKTAEAGIVGNEGFTGTRAVVGLSRGPLEAVVQITGHGFRINARRVGRALHRASMVVVAIGEIRFQITAGRKQAYI
jgi:hypothetical protein